MNRFSAHLRILRGVRAKLEEILILDCKCIAGRRPVQIGQEGFLTIVWKRQWTRFRDERFYEPSGDFWWLLVCRLKK